MDSGLCRKGQLRGLCQLPQLPEQRHGRTLHRTPPRRKKPVPRKPAPGRRDLDISRDLRVWQRRVFLCGTGQPFVQGRRNGQRGCGTLRGRYGEGYAGRHGFRLACLLRRSPLLYDMGRSRFYPVLRMGTRLHQGFCLARTLVQDAQGRARHSPRSFAGIPHGRGHHSERQPGRHSGDLHPQERRQPQDAGRRQDVLQDACRYGSEPDSSGPQSQLRPAMDAANAVGQELQRMPHQRYACNDSGTALAPEFQRYEIRTRPRIPLQRVQVGL